MKKPKKNTTKKSAVKLRKANNKVKLFDCKHIGFHDDRRIYTLVVSPDVESIIKEKLGYDIGQTTKLESYLRKSFRKYFGFRKP